MERALVRTSKWAQNEMERSSIRTSWGLRMNCEGASRASLVYEASKKCGGFYSHLYQPVT